MPTEAEIIASLQFEFLQPLQPIHQTGDAPYQITFQFAGSSQPGDLPTSTVYTGWAPMTAAEQAAVRAAMDHIESLINVSFVEVTGQADPDMNIGKASLGSAAGYGGTSAAWNGNQEIVRYDGFALYDTDLDMSDPAQFSLLLHELGHALGLDHPFDGVVLDPAFDTNKYTVMSYDSNPDNGLDSNAMQIFDILALQELWGAATPNSGDDVYTGPRNTTVDALWDSGGTDLIDASAYTTAVRIDLREAHFSQFGSYEDFVIAYGTVIENAQGGTGADTITGNDQNNHLIGNTGNDTLSGLKGADTLEGNGGKDTLSGVQGNDLLKGAGGRDSLDGGGGRDTLDGGNGDDELFGGNADDLLRGGDGNDKLNGEAGDDTLRGDAGADKFVFKAGHGHDVIKDFEAGLDTIRFKKLGTTQEIAAKGQEIDGDVVFDFDAGGSLTVLNVTLSEISDDFFV